ncbi:MAG: PAS domain-containing protein [Cyanobacteria bacterium SZAS LIN-5]|nr:PAS domain-containing protein [Cyanobacteria bacterium SZAS LIN-5]
MSIGAKINQTSIGLIVLNEAGQVESCNRAVEELFGFEPAQIVGGDLSLLLVDSNEIGNLNFMEYFEQNALDTYLTVQMRSKDRAQFNSEVRLSRLGPEDEGRFLLNVLKLQRNMPDTFAH